MPPDPPTERNHPATREKIVLANMVLAVASLALTLALIFTLQFAKG
jgi:hypothetical protein